MVKFLIFMILIVISVFSVDEKTLKDCFNNFNEEDLIVGEEKADLNEFKNTDLDDRKTTVIKQEEKARIEQEKNPHLRHGGTGSIFLNKNDPKYQKHLKDFEKTINMPILRDELIKALNREGLNCSYDEGSKPVIESPYILGWEDYNEPQDPADHDLIPHFCEFLKNKYDCTDTFHLKCLNISEKGADFEITNFTSSGVRTIFEGLKAAPAEEPQVKLNASINQVTDKIIEIKSTSGEYTLDKVDLYFDIKINTKPELLSSFLVEHFNFKGYGVIKVNNNVAYSLPSAATDISESWVLERMCEWGYPLAVNASDHEKKQSARNIDLKPYLRQGNNRISIRIVLIGKGYIDFRMRVGERICLNWLKEWREECKLLDRQF